MWPNSSVPKLQDAPKSISTKFSELFFIWLTPRHTFKDSLLHSLLEEKYYKLLCLTTSGDCPTRLGLWHWSAEKNSIFKCRFWAQFGWTTSTSCSIGIIIKSEFMISPSVNPDHHEDFKLRKKKKITTMIMIFQVLGAIAWMELKPSKT